MTYVCSRHHLARWATLSCLATCLLLLAGCGKSDQELLTSARGHMAKQDHAAAIIELKNALQAKPDSGEARLLLGQSLFASGDAAGAQAQWQQALDGGYGDDKVLPLLARAMVVQQQFSPLALRYGQAELKDGLAAAELKTQLAMAQMALNMIDEARASIDNALHRAPGYAPALLLRARLLAAQGDHQAALALVDELLVAKPGEANAWVLKAELMMHADRASNAAALEAYRNALRLQPDLLPAHVGLISLLINARDLVAAGKQHETLQQLMPRHPDTLYFAALLALRNGDAKRAREISAGLLAGSQPKLRDLLLAGQAEMQLDALPQAEALLGKAAQLAPQAETPRRMLAQLYLRSGQPDRALATLKPLLDARKPDTDVLSLAGRAQLMLGDAKGAEASFSQAAKAHPDDQHLRTSIALARLGQGQGPLAMSELESVAAKDTGTAADMALISQRMQNKEFDAALKAVDGLAAKQPQMALPDLLRGRIALQRRDNATARKHFESAVAKQPNFFVAVASLAGMDVGQGKPDAARARFEALIKLDPRDPKPHLALAEMAARSGSAKEDVARWLESGIKASPLVALPHAALIDHHLGTGDAAAALAAAQAGAAAVPDNPGLLDRLGRAQQASGDAHQAQLTFTQLASLQPKSALPHLRLAQLSLAKNDAEAATNQVRRAMEAEPDSLPALRAGIKLALRDKQPAQALTIARKAQTQRPDDMAGYMLEGEIELTQLHHDAAAVAFRKALGKTNAAEAAPRLHQALLGANKPDEAERMADGWLKAHPADTAFVVHLGDMALGQGKPAVAEARYRDAIKRQPQQVIALNNLAYLLAMQNKPGAVTLAEQALKLAPDQVSVLDTLATSYARENQVAKAVSTQTRAVALAPDVPGYRLSLAKLQIQAGNTAAARIELDKLATLGKAYAGQDEAAQLRKTLGN
jgi:putative PEP-CTERM system TPR-repeat lipoprotein